MSEESSKAASDRERILARSKKTGKSEKKKDKPQERPETIWFHARGWVDALVFAFMLAMFIRSFVFELFMIPTGSMTPTLIGDEGRYVTEADWDGDGQNDVVAIPDRTRVGFLQLHLRNEFGFFEDMLLLLNPETDVRREFSNPENEGMGRRDMIVVNKFSYWFSEPKRGDIIVFKTPDTDEYPFSVEKPVYIKRCVGLPGETVEIQSLDRYEERPVGHPDRIAPDEYGGIELLVESRPLLIDGEPLEEGLFPYLHHFPRRSINRQGVPTPQADSQVIELADDEVLMLGDNQRNSQDGRYWGGVPLNHLRGRAIIRHLPMRTAGFLNSEKLPGE